MPETFLDRVIFLATSGGTGNFVQASAVAGFQTVGAAGGVNGQTYGYAAQSNDLSQWEVGRGTWASGTSTLSRTVLYNSLGTTAAINFTNPPNVMITGIAEDLLSIDSSITYAGLGQLSLALGTITANAKALNITGTWNAAGVTFDAPLFMNITNTASASLSLLADIQLGGNSLFSVGYQSAAPARSIVNIPPSSSISCTGTFYFADGSSNTVGGNRGISVSISNGGGIAFGPNLYATYYYGGTLDIPGASGPSLVGYLDGAILNTAAFAISPFSKTGGCAFRVYNTTDNVGSTAPTNYERGVFDWTTTANVLTIGTQAGGTGTVRNVQAIGQWSLTGAGGLQVGSTSNIALGLAGTGQIVASSGIFISYISGVFTAGINASVQGFCAAANNNFGWSSGSTANNYDVAFSRVQAALVELQNGTAGGVAQVRINAQTVASLPAASATYKGARATVSDANATLTAGIGAVVAGAGTNIVPVFCDGTNWRIG